MKRVLMLAAVCAAAIQVAAVTLTPDNVEIVAAKGACGPVTFAAKEMADFLGKAFGAPLKVVSQPTAGKASIILGSNDWTRAVGIDTAALAHDEFVIKAEGGKVYIAGRDARGSEAVLKSISERATLFGAYEFLYRFAGEPAVDTSSAPAFKDVKSTDYFYRPVIWAASKGITTGYTDSHGNPTGKFGSGDGCTRGQVVTFLYRYDRIS